jgi:hypothetical protein
VTPSSVSHDEEVFMGGRDSLSTDRMKHAEDMDWGGRRHTEEKWLIE